ncbi:hypothetical protein GBA65_00600 [Rubrobacter marinus]|uniref:Uncharacterized protein n=1 Tax=Rubrobacter marinus TaxID=2653852 RepID=A0A6G8PTK0_9ACTN|nr:hypothetical protein [Rubrobacter marinus]QIN77261.1 hypothetical protein GBA65_00600 [Rubrobacter marinus]
MCGRKISRSHGPDPWASVSPRGRIFASLAVLVPVALSGLALVALAPAFWWIFTTYFWISFPALGLLASGISGLSGDAVGGSSAGGKERELLEALRERGELTPAGAAMETSLTVAEAGAMLGGLAEGGHLEVRARGGALSYALWEVPERTVPRSALGEPRHEPPGLELLESGRDATGRDLERSGT